VDRRGPEGAAGRKEKAQGAAELKEKRRKKIRGEKGGWGRIERIPGEEKHTKRSIGWETG